MQSTTSKHGGAQFILLNTPEDTFSSFIYTRLTNIPQLSARFPKLTSIRDDNTVVTFLFDLKKGWFVTDAGGNDAEVGEATGLSPSSLVTWATTPKEICRMVFRADDKAADLISTAILGGTIAGVRYEPIPLDDILRAYEEGIKRGIASAATSKCNRERAIDALNSAASKVIQLSILSDLDVRVNKLVLELLLSIGEIAPADVASSSALLDRLDALLLPVLAALQHQHTLYDGVYEGQDFNILLPLRRIQHEVARRNDDVNGCGSRYFPRCLGEMRRMSLRQVCVGGTYGFADPRERLPGHMGDAGGKEHGGDGGVAIDACDY